MVWDLEHISLGESNFGSEIFLLFSYPFLVVRLDISGFDLFAEDDRVKLGKKQWQLCVSCHGAQGYGNAKLQAPAIAGLPAWYSVEQLTKFKGGIRGKHPQHNAGIRMYAMARMLKPKDIENVSHYVASLKPKKQERTLQEIQSQVKKFIKPVRPVMELKDWATKFSTHLH